MVSQTVEGALFTGLGNLTTSSTVAGTTLTVTNGALATTYGVSATTNAGGLTVGIRAADLTGTANTINLVAAAAGSTVVQAGIAPVSNVQTITMGSTGVEAVALATSGTNVLALVDTPAAGVATDYASLTITGSGNNTIDVSALTQTLTYNASTATGTNTLNFGTALQSNTSITGGTGADTIRVNQNSTVAGITVAGVETLRSSTGASTGTIAFNTGSSLTTLRVDGDTTENSTLTLINPGAIATVNYIGAGLTVDLNNAQDFKAVSITGAYAGTADTLTANLSNAGTSTLAGYNVRAITANGMESFVANVTQADTAAMATFAGINSNTLQTVKFNSPSAVTATINATPVAGSSSLASVDLSAISTATAQSAVTLANGSVGLATQVLGAVGTGGTFLTLAAEAAGDVVMFTGGQGNDRVDSTGFAGTLIASMGQGTNAINTGDGTTITIATLSGAGSANRITGGTGADTITVTANGVGSTNTVIGAGGADVISISASTVAVTVAGQAGNDTITLGAGADTLAFSGGALGAVTGTGAQVTTNLGSDTVTGYSVAADSITLSQASFGSTSTGAVGALAAAKFSAVATATTNVAVDYTAGGFLYNQATGDVIYTTADMTDPNTNTIAELTLGTNAVIIATLVGAPAIVVGEFTVVA